jgi:capsular exopolysaccharide synthesis family protein
VRIGKSDLDSGWRAILHGKWHILGIAVAAFVAAAAIQAALTFDFRLTVPAGLFALVVVCGSAIAYLRSARRSDRLSAPAMATQLPEAPMLGRIPALTDARMAAAPGGIVRERSYASAIRSVALTYSADSSRSNSIILITSVNPGEGKTSVALNLAAALARDGRILLVDGDLRAATLSRLLSLPRYDAGLTELIARTAPYRSCLALTAIPNLHVIRTGSLPAEPLTVLNSTRFARTLELSKRHYDHIVIDTPALGAHSDAMLLAGQADAVVLVADARTGQFKKIRTALKKLKHVNARCAGIVFNRVNSP